MDPLSDSDQAAPPAVGPETPPQESRRKTPRGPLGLILSYTRGLIYDQHLRRVTMFYVVLAALLLIAFDAIFGLGWREHPIRFAIYWLACAWLTMLAVLLAIYDMLLIRVQHRLARRQLRKRILGEEHAHEPEE